MREIDELKKEVDKKDYTPISTAKAIEDFVRHSSVWKDIRTELSIWLGEVHEMLENLDGSLPSRMLDRLGGCAEAIRNFEDLPHTILTNIDSKTEKTKKTGEEAP